MSQFFFNQTEKENSVGGTIGTLDSWLKSSESNYCALKPTPLILNFKFLSPFSGDKSASVFISQFELIKPTTLTAKHFFNFYHTIS